MNQNPVYNGVREWEAVRVNFDDDELHEKPSETPQEREISLGTGTILGIFLALTLVCAAFFGFGYSMGHRSAQAAAASIPETNTVAKSDQPDPAFNNFKAAPVADAPSHRTFDVPADEAPATTTTRSAKTTPSDPAAASSLDPAAPVDQPPVTSDGTWMVQVSATTRKPDAEALTKVLVGKGFTAAIKQDADQKFHVRVGPFASKKDADTTRKLLIASGYKDPFLSPR